jgi:hypothetical protein
VVAFTLLMSPRAWCVFPAGNPINGAIPQSSLSITLEDVVTIPNSSGSLRPRLEFLTSGGAPGLAYVFDQRGKIYSFNPSLPSPTPSVFLDLSTAVANFNDGAQAGVRGLAFHPDFNNPAAPGYRKLYTAHSRSPSSAQGNPVDFPAPSPPGLNHYSVLGEWTMNTNGTVNTGSYRELMRIGQPYADHNIGQIDFNPNAMPSDADYGNLYIATGDGGNVFPIGQIDPHDHGQGLDEPFGAVLRINPLASGSNPYTVPTDNPFRVDSTPASPQNLIWAYGLRNPHRFTFDTGGDHKMLITDIGQSNVEEVNLGAAGANYGWDLREGTFVTTSVSGGQNFVDPLPANHAGDVFTYPVAQYDHDWDNNNSIEGLWSIVGVGFYLCM